VAAPGFNDGFDLGAREEPFHAQALVAELAVEAFADAVLPPLPDLSPASTPQSAAFTGRVLVQRHLTSASTHRSFRAAAMDA
jgi:hypothetical protein